MRVIIAIIGLLVATSAYAGIFGRDDRVFVSHARGSLYGPIGMIDNIENDYSGTAFLIDECHVLTAQHIGSDDQILPIGHRMKFLVGEGTIRSFEKQILATVIATGGYDPASAYRMRSDDWMILRLDECIGREFGFVRLNAHSMGGRNPASLTTNTVLKMAGFPEDRDYSLGLTIDPDCRAIGYADQTVLHNCDSWEGNSGGIIFREISISGRLELEVFALQVAGERKHFPQADIAKGIFNIATLVRHIAYYIRNSGVRPHYRGSLQADVLIGAGLPDLIEGGQGNDTILLDDYGKDTLSGGKGRDRFVVQQYSRDDHVIVDFNPAEGDVIDLSALDSNENIDGIQPYKVVAVAPVPKQLDNEVGRAVFQYDAVKKRTSMELYNNPYHRAPDFRVYISGKITRPAGFRGLQQ